jgi:sodium/potassium/calcium exchanger 6
VELLAAAADRCAFARANCSEVGSGAFGSYIEHWHCTFAESGAALLPLGIWLAMLIAALCSTADTFLIPQLTYISNLLRLKPDVAGVTLLAFGNGAPDVFTGVAIATAHPEEVDFSLLLADIVGGSIFIMTVVVGAVVWVAAKHSPGWRLSRMPFYRDTISFFVAISLLLGVASHGIVYAWEGAFFLGNYVFYVVLVIAIRYYIQPCWPDDSFGIYLRGACLCPPPCPHNCFSWCAPALCTTHPRPSSPVHPHTISHAGRMTRSASTCEVCFQLALYLTNLKPRPLPGSSSRRRRPPSPAHPHASSRAGRITRSASTCEVLAFNALPASR